MIDYNQRIKLPSALRPAKHEMDFVPFVEVCFQVPYWHVQVLSVAADEDGKFQHRRRIVLSSLEDALRLLALDTWQEVELFVELPAHMTGESRPVLEACVALFECQDAEIDQTCWRIETDHRVVIESMVGTKVGEERVVRKVWGSGAVSMH